jgi:hypothetical protein
MTNNYTSMNFKEYYDDFGNVIDVPQELDGNIDLFSFTKEEYLSDIQEDKKLWQRKLNY